MPTPIERLENYSRFHPREVLRLTVWEGDETGEVLVYKGFSSSLTSPTAFDPDVPVLSPQAQILWVDRLSAPYDPQNPRYLEQHIPWDEFAQRLDRLGF
ncbi:MAG: hypothetical protein Q6L55_00200 [Gloeomargarita sp. SRBZ-1_bins_9]